MDSFEEFELVLSTPRGSYFSKTRNKEHHLWLPGKKGDYTYYKNMELNDSGMVSFHLIPPQTNSYIITIPPRC
jgi:hypothetical protein